MSIIQSAALVSIIIPTYNRTEYLRAAVDSVLQQTYTHLEIIVADDCSPHNPQELIDSFNDPRLTLHRNSTNLGNGPNIANAFQLAQGKYVASLNDDDYWHPSFVEILMRPLEANPDLAIAFCDHYIVDADGTIDQAASNENSRRWRRDSLPEGIYRPFVEQALVHQSVSPASSALLRSSAVSWAELLPVGVKGLVLIIVLSDSPTIAFILSLKPALAVAKMPAPKFARANLEPIAIASFWLTQTCKLTRPTFAKNGLSQTRPWRWG
jgi:glycosyltransferase involved in cell wall biosynthesis